MIKSIKELKKNMDARLHREEVERDEEGRAVIEMTVMSDEDFLSDFSVGRRPTVSSEVAEFLEESARAFLPAEPIRLNIYSDCITEEKQEGYSAALKEYYKRHYEENRRDLRRNAWISLIMAIIGIIALTVVITLAVFEKLPVFSEAIDIFAWVFLWEAVDLFFLERAVLRAKRNRYLRLIDANIVFYPKTEE